MAATLTRIALWNPITEKFGDYEPTVHSNRRLAETSFKLSETLICKHAKASKQARKKSETSTFWSYARIELVKENGRVLKSFALPKSARRAVRDGRKVRCFSTYKPSRGSERSSVSLSTVAKVTQVPSEETKSLEQKVATLTEQVQALVAALAAQA